MENSYPKDKVLETLRKIAAKKNYHERWVGIYYILVTEQGNVSESLYGILQGLDEYSIVIESLATTTLPLKHMFIYKVITRTESLEIERK